MVVWAAGLVCTVIRPPAKDPRKSALYRKATKYFWLALKFFTPALSLLRSSASILLQVIIIFFNDVHHLAFSKLCASEVLNYVQSFSPIQNEINSVMKQPGILLDKRDPELFRRRKNHLVVLASDRSCNVLHPGSPGSKHVVDEGELYIVSPRAIIRREAGETYESITRHHYIANLLQPFCLLLC